MKCISIASGVRRCEATHMAFTTIMDVSGTLVARDPKNLLSTAPVHQQILVRSRLLARSDNGKRLSLSF